MLVTGDVGQSVLTVGRPVMVCQLFYPASLIDGTCQYLLMVVMLPDRSVDGDVRQSDGQMTDDQ